MGATRRFALLASAALAGAAGLGNEALLLSSTGLLVGYGRASIGIAAWVAGWALGAWLAGRLRLSGARWLAVFGVAAGLAAPAAFYATLAAARAPLGDGAAAWLGAALVAFAALPQGGFLPLFAREWTRSRAGTERGAGLEVSWLFAASFVGSVFGVRWIGHDLAGALGRPWAAWIAGALAVGAGVTGAVAVRRFSGESAGAGQDSGERAPPPGTLAPWRAGVIAGLGTAWLIGIQSIALRLGSVWLGGMQPAITAVLSASMVALAIGAALVPRFVPRGTSGVALVLVGGALSSVWLVAPELATFDWLGFDPLRLEGVPPARKPVGFMLLLVGPPLLVLGALVPVLHRATAGESGARLGALLLHESWGAALGIPLVHVWLLPSFGIAGTLAVLSLLALPAVQLCRPWPALRTTIACAAVVLAALLAARARPPVLASPSLSNPAFSILSFEEDEHFAVTVVDDGVRGERTLLTDDFRATAVGDDYLYMRVLGHLPLLLHADPRRVGVLAFGTGTTAGAVSLHSIVERLDVMEISPAVLEAAPFFEEVNRGVLEDEGGRVRVHLGDGRRTLARLRGELDVLTMEPLLPDSPFAVYLYTREFYERARQALAPGGLCCQWVPPHALAPETFDAVVDAFTRSFDWSGVFLFGTQVILLGGEREPLLSAGRFAPDESGLHHALSALGLDEPAGVMARFVTSGDRWPRGERPLTDGDPWVIYRPRPRGRASLAWLPRNFERLRRLEADPPLAWQVETGAKGMTRLEIVRTLHRAREAWRVWDLARQQVPYEDDPSLGLLEVYRQELSEAGAADPELDQFDRQVRFDAARVGGFADLARGFDGPAFEKLTLAASLRPERADVHLFVAIAAHRTANLGVARAAADRAYALCPGLLATPQGQRALAVGLPAPLAAPSR